MAAYSGKHGTVSVDGTEITPITDWNISDTSDNKEYCANDTSGRNKRVAGVGDCSGKFTIVAEESGDGAVCRVTAGDEMTLILCTHYSHWDLTAIVDSVDEDVNVKTGDIVTYVVNFSGSGACAETSGSGVA